MREVFKHLPDGMTKEEFVSNYRSMIDTIKICHVDPVNRIVNDAYIESMSNFLAQDLANKVLKGNIKEAEEMMDIMVKIATGEIE